MANRSSSSSDSSGPLRIGSVPYSNAWPLIHDLPSEIPGSVISEWLPSAMRLRLMAHHLDLALMPVAELMNLPYGKIIGNCCIAADGPVRSVRILSRKPLEKIRTISLDTASRSSITVCELMLRHFYDLTPTRYKLSADKPLDECPTDALVVIGDRALSYEPADHWEYRFDVGQLWKEKTGLPFVFAAWIGCSERAFEDPSIVCGLQTARDLGLEHLDRILDEKERRKIALPVSRSEMLSYFTRSIVYRLGEEERRGLQSFFDLALIHGFAKHRTVLEIVEA